MPIVRSTKVIIFVLYIALDIQVVPGVYYTWNSK